PVVVRPRGHVGAEEPEADAPEAAQRAEAVALALGRGDRSRPVGLQPELRRAERERMAVDREPNRFGERRLRALLEEDGRLGARQPADVDGVDANALRERLRR